MITTVLLTCWWQFWRQWARLYGTKEVGFSVSRSWLLASFCWWCFWQLFVGWMLPSSTAPLSLQMLLSLFALFPSCLPLQLQKVYLYETSCSCKHILMSICSIRSTYNQIVEQNRSLSVLGRTFEMSTIKIILMQKYLLYFILSSIYVVCSMDVWSFR